MDIPEKFVEKHFEEIRRIAYALYQQRQRYNQPDDADANFLRGIAIVKEQYQIKDMNRL